jgi:hypothetical protein
VNRRQALPLSGAIEPAKLMIAQREVPVAPFHIGTGTLEHVRQLLGLWRELASLGRAQLGQPATGLKQRRAQPLGQLAKRLATPHRATLGHALEIACRDEMGMRPIGHRWGQVEPADLLAHIARDNVDGGLHCRHHPLGFVAPIQAVLREGFVLGDAANGVDVALDIGRNELAVSPPPALSIDKMGGLADAPDALADLLALPADALELLAGGLRLVLSLLQAQGGLDHGVGHLRWPVVPRKSAKTSASEGA